MAANLLPLLLVGAGALYLASKGRGAGTSTNKTDPDKPSDDGSGTGGTEQEQDPPDASDDSTYDSTRKYAQLTTMGDVAAWDAVRVKHPTNAWLSSLSFAEWGSKERELTERLEAVAKTYDNLLGRFIDYNTARSEVIEALAASELFDDARADIPGLAGSLIVYHSVPSVVVYIVFIFADKTSEQTAAGKIIPFITAMREETGGTIQGTMVSLDNIETALSEIKKFIISKIGEPVKYASFSMK